MREQDAQVLAGVTMLPQNGNYSKLSDIINVYRMNFSIPV